MIKLFVKMALSKNKQGTRWDFMSQLLNDTLSAWLLIESLSPGEVNFTAEDILSAEHFKMVQSKHNFKVLMNILKYGMLNALLYQKKNQRLGNLYLNFIDIASAIMKLI